MPMGPQKAALADRGLTQGANGSEADNRLRFDREDRRGHVESLFLKGNSPDGQRALWIKYTILAPREHPERAAAELWAIAFDRALGAPIAAKRSFPLHEVEIHDAPFLLRLPSAELSHGHARGELRGAGAHFRWDLRYACAPAAFRPFPSARMYTGVFPRTKTLTPAPSSQLTGYFEVGGERWDVSGYSAAQGHNWGKGHAHAYAWAHACAFDPATHSAQQKDVWVELVSGQVRVGPLLTPWLSCAAISIDGTLYRFDGLGSMLSRAISVDPRSYTFRFRQGAHELSGAISAEPSMIAGLRYEDPDGNSLACLNSKLASGSFTLRTPKQTFRFESQRVALEIGTRATDHGIAILV